MPYINVKPENQNEFATAVNSVAQETHAKHPPYSYPANKQEWWATVDEYWAELFEIINRYAPSHIDFPDEFPAGLPIDTGVCVTKLKQEQNSELANILERTWGSAPDEGSIHLNPAWDVLCDLCSESYVLFEET
jgi:hypothetical protein